MRDLRGYLRERNRKQASWAVFWAPVAIGGAFAAVILALSVLLEVEPSGSTGRPSRDAVRGAGYLAAKECVSDALLSPSTAEFPWSTVDASIAGDGCYVVRGAVDAQNAFGVPIRHWWEVTLTEVSDAGYTVERIELEGQPIARRR